MSEDDLRQRLEQLERQRAEELAKAHAELAAAQDRAYWLDRWQLDLNALMRRPGAGLVRAALRALRSIYRFVYDVRSQTGKKVGGVRARLVSARARLERERAHADVAQPPTAWAGRLMARPVTDALNGQVDEDDPRALAALVCADAIVAAFTQTGVVPQAGRRWVGLGPGAEDVLRLLGKAHPELDCRGRDELAGEPADAVFALSGWASAESALERLTDLRGALGSGGALLIGAERDTQSIVTPGWLASHATPDWRVALYLPGGLDGDRDLYVLERS